MGNFWTEQGIFLFFIVLFLLFSVGCQMIIFYYLIQMLKESQTLEEGNPKLLREWLSNFLKEENQITNITVYVEKSIHEFRIWNFPLMGIKHASGQFLLLAVLGAGIGACRGIITGKTVGQILPYYILCMLGLYVHLSLSGAIDMEEKKKMIQTNLIDFLENHKPYLCGDVKKEKEELEKVPVPLFGEKEERELEELLREILA